MRCCPVLYELRCDGTDPIIDLPYRMIFAIGTNTDIVLYDTQQLAPFAHLQNVHYTRITDLTWSLDGLLLVASSTDGYCTLITFDPDELGIEYNNSEECVLDTTECEELEEVSKIEKHKSEEELKVKKPSMLEQWTIRKSKNELENETSSISSNPETKISKSNLLKVTKRIVPTKIDDSKTAGEKVLPTATLTTNTQHVSKKTPINNISEEEKSVSHINKRKIEVKEPASSPLLKYFKSNTKAVEKGTKLSDKIDVSLNSNTKVISKQVIQAEIIEITDDSCDSISENNIKVNYSEVNSLKISNGDTELKSSVENITDEAREEVKCVQKKLTRNEKENLTTDDILVPPESTITEPSSSLENRVTIQPKVIRRIPLVTLSSPKRKKKN